MTRNVLRNIKRKGKLWKNGCRIRMTLPLEYSKQANKARKVVKLATKSLKKITMNIKTYIPDLRVESRPLKGH